MKTFGAFDPIKRLAGSILIRAIRDLYVTKRLWMAGRRIKRAAMQDFLALVRQDARDWIFYDGAEGWDHVMWNGAWRGGFTVRWCCDMIDWDVEKVRRLVNETPPDELMARIRLAMKEVGGGSRGDVVVEEDQPEPARVPFPLVEVGPLEWAVTC